VFAGVSSPTNKMIGIGFEDAVDPHALDPVERLFAERGAALQAEVSSLADATLPGLLVGRGYVPAGYENVLGHPLQGLDATPPDGISISFVTPEERDTCIDVAVAAFAAPDVGGVGGDTLPPSDELRRWMRLTMAADGFECIAARIGERVVGYAALRLDHGVAQLCGAGTLPEFRRRGVQTALLRWRLMKAKAAGCEVAVVTTQPASKSQSNVQREGFSLLYVRQLLVRPPTDA
jgi:ribosomal protein S18 acetylase RimI-like enzyme